MLVFALAVALAAASEELSKKVGSCWLLTIKDIDQQRTQMDRIIESISSYNRTQIYYKVQMDMIIRCTEVISADEQVSERLA